MTQRRPKIQAGNPDLRTVMKSNDKQHKENTERLISIAGAMQAHIEADAKAFEASNREIREINKDVKELLASRSFLRGAWFAIGVFGTGLVALVGALIAWYK